MADKKDFIVRAGLTVSTNASVNTALSVGNSTVNVVINSTAFSGTSNNALTANNATNLGGVAAASYVQNTDSRTLSGNLNFTGANTTISGNATINGTLNANDVNISGNLTVSGTSYLQGNVTITDALIANGSSGSAGQVLHSNGTATYWATDDVGTGTVTSVATGNGVTGGPITTSGTIYILANNGITSNTSGLFVTQGTGLVVNTTGVHVNASYVQNTDSRTLSGNLVFSGANVTFSSAAYVGANVVANVSGFYVGNSTVNAAIIAGSVSINGAVLPSNSYLTSTYAPLVSPTFTGTVTTANITANVISANATTTNNITVNANLTVRSIVANGSLGNTGQVLTTNGANVYWANSTAVGGGNANSIFLQYTGNGTNTVYTIPGGYTNNSIAVYLNGVLVRNGVDANVASGSDIVFTEAPPSGSLIDVVGIAPVYNANGFSAAVSQQFTGNGTANSFTITGGYIANTAQVFLNGVKQIPGVDVITTSGTTVNFITPPASGYTIDVSAYQGAIVATNSAIVVGNTNIGLSGITTDQLDVNGNVRLFSTGPVTLTLEADTDNITETDNPRIVFKQDGGVVNGRVGYANNTNTLEIFNEYTDSIILGTSNTERVNIAANGNVGIGTSTPSAKLYVNGDSAFNGNVGIGVTPAADRALYVAKTLTTDSTQYGQVIQVIDANTAMTAARNKTGLYNFIVNYNQNKSSDGLTSYGSNYISVLGYAYNSDSSTGGDARANLIEGVRGLAWQYANGANANTINLARGVLGQVQTFGTGVITSAYGVHGFVGVGNNTVAGNITTAYGVISQIQSNTAATIGNGYLYYGDYSGSTITTKYGLYLSGESFNYFSGNVAIGTTSFGDKLVVSTSANTNAGMTLYNTNTGPSTQAVLGIATSGATGLQLGQNYSSKNVFIYTGDAASMTFSTNATAAMTIAANSNIGIGTTSPAVALQINQAVPQVRLVSTNNSVDTRLLSIGDSTVGIVGTYSNHSFVVYANNAESTRFAANGNVGIGTASPAVKLSVNGQINDSIGNVRSVPQNAQTTAYTLVASDNGKHISITTGGVTVPASVFSIGDTITVYNNSASNQTITQGAGVTMYLVGTATTGNRTLAQRGLATVVCVAANTFVITGGGLT